MFNQADSPVCNKGLILHRFDLQNYAIYAHDPDGCSGGQVSTRDAPGRIINPYDTGMVADGFLEGESATDILFAPAVQRGLIGRDWMGTLVTFEQGEADNGKARE